MQVLENKLNRKKPGFCSLNFLFLPFLFVFFFANTFFCQGQISIIKKNLSEKGFENLLVNSFEKRVVVAYENRVFRFELEAIKEIIDLVVPLISDAEELTLIPLNRKIPIILLTLKTAEYEKFKKGEIDAESFVNSLDITNDVDIQFNKLNQKEEENSSNFKFDLVINPSIKYQLGAFNKPFRGYFSLDPDLRSGFWKGMQIKYEEVIPLFNEFGTRDDSVHTGSVTLNQTFRLPNNLFLSSTLGVFTNDRYGFDLEFKKYFMNGDISFGGNFGFTSYISFSGLNRILYNDKFIFTGNLNSEYRIQKYDLTLGLSMGKYLLDDNTIRFDINREFGEIEIGFFAMRSFGGISNGGVILTVPLFPSKYWNPSTIRPRITETYTLSYLVTADLKDQIGKRYNSGNRINSFIKKLNPGFIKRSLLKILQTNTD